MFQGLRTAVYKVKDLQSAKAWYADILGVAPYFDEPFYVGFNVGGFELGLDPDAENTIAGNTVLIYWGVANAAEAYEKLLEKGAKTHEEPHDVGGNIVVASVYDPFGNVFGVIENPHFKIEN